MTHRFGIVKTMIVRRKGKEKGQIFHNGKAASILSMISEIFLSFFSFSRNYSGEAKLRCRGIGDPISSF